MAFEITSGSIPAMDSDSKPVDRLTIFEDLESDMFDTMAIDHGAATPSALSHSKVRLRLDKN